LDLEPDLAIGRLIVGDQDVIILPDVDAGVGEGPGARVAGHAALRGADRKDRVRVVLLRGVPADAEAIDAREVDAEAREALDGEAAHLDVPEARPRVAARRELDVGGGERVRGGGPATLRLRGGARAPRG